MKPRYLYFFLTGVAAAPGRFLPLFYNEHGLTTSQIGILLGFQTILSIFATPFFSHKADVAKTRQTIMIVLQIASTSCFLLQIPFLPFLHILPSQEKALPFLFTAGLFYGLFAAPIEAILRGIAISYLKKIYGSQGSVMFGRERMFGTVAWAIVSFTVGVLFDLPTVVTLPAIYVLHTALSISNVVITAISIQDLSLAPSTASASSNVPIVDEAVQNGDGDQQGYQPFSFLSAIHPVVFQGGLTTFFFFNLIFLYGFGIAVVENLLFLYLVNELHASNTLCGLSIVLSVIVEVIMYAVSPYMLKKMSVSNVLFLSSIAYVIRVLGYAYIPNPNAVLALELLHGLTFATGDAAFVTFIAERGELGTEATVQSIYWTVRAVGMGVGSVSGGIVLQKFGATILYVMSGLLVFLGSLTFLIVYSLDTQPLKSLSKQAQGLEVSDENTQLSS